jgi:hypothetical protein
MLRTTVKFYVDFKGGSRTVTGYKSAKRVADRMAAEHGYASVSSSILDGYHKLYEKRG